MRCFRLFPLSLFIVQNAFGQAGESPKPEAPPPAPVPPEESDEPEDDTPAGDEKAPKESSPKPEEPKKSPEPPPSKKPPQEDDERPGEGAEADEEISDDDLEAELGGPDMKKPPPKGQGAVVGVVTDTKFNEPLVEAQVEVVGLKKRTFTDVEGRFRLELPPGTYSIRVAYELHKSSRAEGVRVVAGKIERVNLELVPDESAVDEIVVETELEQASTEGATLERKRSAAVGDGVGRAEIARTPDRNAAEAAQRVVGATIVGGRFVFVRGLGERYTNALLNGTPLPSPEPDRQTVPLDLFPSLVLDSLNIVKQFTPDSPGDFAGGSVRINTREFPRETLFQVSLGAGYNTEATFRDRLDYRGSGTDWLGFDGGVRQLPDGIPSRRLEDSDTIPWGQRLNSYLSTLRAGTPPNHGVNVVAGDSWKFGKDLKVGVVGALSYGRTYQLRHVIKRNFRFDPPGSDILRVSDSFTGEEGVDTVRWGAFANGSVEITPKHKLSLTALRSQTADDVTSMMEGVLEANQTTTLRSTQLEYVSRSLDFAQLRGHHELPGPTESVVDWHGAISVANRDQPDTRDVRYSKAPAGAATGPGYTWQSTQQSPSHFFSEQTEVSLSGGLDLTQLIFRGDETETKLKLGTLITNRQRDFSARRFRFQQPTRNAEPLGGLEFCAGEAWNRACPDRLFRNDVIDGERLELDEYTFLFDEYEAKLDVFAAYAMIDSQVIKEVRVVTGARVESTDQRFVAYDPFDHDSDLTQRSVIDRTDVLPALSVVYAVTQATNARFGLSQTLARPQLRETTPFLSSSYTADFPTQGNANLKLTRIVNADLRLEHFPTLRETVAFSFFYKRFKDPIEEVMVAQGGTVTQTWENADSANLIGLELEARKTLAFVTPILRDFTAIANLTLAHSRVEINREGFPPESRALAQQAPYVVNFSLDYANTGTGTDIRLLYNVTGPRIARAGFGEALPHLYELPRHLLDVTAAQDIAEHFEIKLAAQNLLWAPIRFAHLDETGYVLDPATGRYNSIGEDPVARRYQPGATFTLTATYTY